MRTATLQRDTKETQISGTLRIEGRGRYEISTGIRFFDHMLELFTKHGGFDLALHAKGMMTRDIQDIVKELYGVEVSPTLVSEITADLDAEVSAWRTRRLDGVWPIVYLDGIVVHVRGENGRVSQHTMYVAIGVNLQGRKELLGLWLGQSEGAKFWLHVLTEIKNRVWPMSASWSATAWPACPRRSRRPGPRRWCRPV